MKKVFIAKDPADAHRLRGFLEGENIESEVRGEFLYGVRGEVPISQETCPSVWVIDDADYDRAMELVSTFREGVSRAPIEWKIWRCGCGEENESRFTECWSCGKARPDFLRSLNGAGCRITTGRSVRLPGGKS